MLDIDNFKNYNDAYGHPAGDVVLATVAKVIQRNLRRPYDAVARYGGEEFILLLSCNDLAGVTQVLEKIRMDVEALGIEHGDSQTAEVVTVSIGGVLVRPGDACESDQAVIEADRQLYKAKNEGRNCIRCRKFCQEDPD